MLLFQSYRSQVAQCPQASGGVVPLVLRHPQQQDRAEGVGGNGREQLAFIGQPLAARARR
eukprot:8732461-Prorocentrum_lima.AAC.1